MATTHGRVLRPPSASGTHSRAAAASRLASLTPAQAQALQLLASRSQGRAVHTTSAPGRRPAPRPQAARTLATRKARARKEARADARRAWVRNWWREGVLAAAAVVLVPSTLAMLATGSTAGLTGHPADDSALALTAQTTLLSSADSYRQLEQTVVHRRNDVDQALTVQKSAAEQEIRARAVVGSAARALYEENTAERDPVLGLDVTHPGTTQDVLYRAALSSLADNHREEQVVLAQRSAAAVTAAAYQVTEARTALAAASRRAAAALTTLRATADSLSPGVTARLAGLSRMRMSSSVQQRNQAALHRWQNYLGALASAGIEPPPAGELSNPRTLPEGLSPALASNGRPIPGVAQARVGQQSVTVLPAETVAAVSSALAQLGKPYVPGASGQAAYDCGGFTATSWLMAGFALPLDPVAQWARGTTVPTTQLEPGDLVVTGGGTNVGMYLGGGDVLGASAASHQVGVRRLPAGAMAVRVTLGAPAVLNRPLSPPSALSACGAPLPPHGDERSSTSPANVGWGGWSNGQIPVSALCPIAAGQSLRCDAATRYNAMSDAYQAAFGTPLCITDSYRSLAAQVDAHLRKPGITAIPGTSNHGWGLAVDLCGGINAFGTAQAGWMEANAGRFGWVHPGWAQFTGSNPEPWHWEFGYIS